VFAPSGRLGLAIVLARPALAVFTIAGVVFYLVSCTRQSRIRLFALTLADLWRLPSLALFSGVFWLSVLLLVLLDALYRLLRFIHWLWRSN
jgi:hypothetical protein